jgi:tRNA-(ms[2]io[6]A)-hydroxylase
LSRGFRLRYATPSSWVERVETDLVSLLADHAHCELKAAAFAQTMVVKNHDQRGLVDALSEVAACELEHFRQVLAVLYARGGALGPATPGPYAEGLLESSKAGRGAALLDRLLVAGLIEARSLERFHLLATHLGDRALAALYQELLPSEAEHQLLFFDLACELFSTDMVERRADELSVREAQVVATLPFEHRMHSGVV